MHHFNTVECMPSVLYIYVSIVQVFIFILYTGCIALGFFFVVGVTTGVSVYLYFTNGITNYTQINVTLSENCPGDDVINANNASTKLQGAHRVRNSK